ncbi:MAG: class I SAM-dependent methyltransferase [Oceanococcus sp.]|nr:MAG: class I SAM-dependent methyltransferase [Oceanococcus sp.]
MTKSANNGIRPGGRLRQLTNGLKSTPLHPQWLTHRLKSGRDKWIIKHARGSILDIGCADRFAEELLNSDSYTGLDYPETGEMMYGARPDVFGAAERLPFAPDSFDTVLLLEVLEHVVDDDSVLKEIARVMKPKGQLLLSIPFFYPVHDAPHDYRRLTPFGLQNALHRAGLRLSSVSAENPGLVAAAQTIAISLAHTLVNRRHPGWLRLLLAPACIPAIWASNLLGFLAQALTLSSAEAFDEMLATGYRLVATRLPQHE